MLSAESGWKKENYRELWAWNLDTILKATVTWWNKACFIFCCGINWFLHILLFHSSTSHCSKKTLKVLRLALWDTWTRCSEMSVRRRRTEQGLRQGLLPLYRGCCLSTPARSVFQKSPRRHFLLFTHRNISSASAALQPFVEWIWYAATQQCVGLCLYIGWRI